jgi:hypothetical protein
VADQSDQLVRRPAERFVSVCAVDPGQHEGAGGDALTPTVCRRGRTKDPPLYMPRALGTHADVDVVVVVVRLEHSGGRHSALLERTGWTTYLT